MSPLSDQPDSSVRLAFADGIASVTLDRPKSLNAFSMELVADLNAALDRVIEARRRVRCVLLTGNGRAFSAGGDISAHHDRPEGSEPYDLGDVLHRHFNPLLMRLLQLPMPLVIAVNGPAAGAGCPLALAGDVVLAARSATFECGFIRIGLMPDLGATWLLPRLIGRARAQSMMMLDERVTAERAEQWGMIYACVDDEQLQDAARAIALKLAAGPADALTATRRSILAAGGGSLADALDAEADTQRDLGFSADFAEGIAAFFARRTPIYGKS
jgi:2-(1,2-epoxy-1,2-dihydrophenyl)acetyl-CoA isomerase